MSEKYFIGVSGWSHPAWRGDFLPAKNNPAFPELHFYAKFFNVVETTTTFYHPQSIEASRRWLRETAHNPDFQFIVKLWQKLVEEQSPYELEDVNRTCAGLDVLHDAGKLGAVLLAFPETFDYTLENRSWLFRLMTTFRKYPLVADLEHESWRGEEARLFLREQGIALVMTPAEIAASREEGDGEPGSSKKFDFLRLTSPAFSEREFHDIFTKIQRDRRETVFMIAIGGEGVASLKTAFQMRAEIEKCTLLIPKELLLACPELVKIGAAEHSDQLELFENIR